MAREPITKHGGDHRAPGTNSASDPGGHDPIPGLENIGKDVPVRIALVQYENITGLANDTIPVVMDVLGSPGPSTLDDIFAVSSAQDLIVTDVVASGFYNVAFAVQFSSGSAWQGPVSAQVIQLGGADDFSSAGAADAVICGGPHIADTSALLDASNRWIITGSGIAYVSLLAGHSAPLALSVANASDHTLNVQHAVVMATRISSYTLA